MTTEPSKPQPRNEISDRRVMVFDTVSLDRDFPDDFAELHESQVEGLVAKIQARGARVRDTLRVNQAYVCRDPDGRTPSPPQM